MKKTLPILYSFRRCPYAMRARLAIIYSGVQVALREVELKNKPTELLDISPKATVPVLQCPDGHIIDESRNIMLWALKQHDPDCWLESIDQPLIYENDGSFKKSLDCYKYADRFPKYSQMHYREQGEIFLEKVEKLLEKHKFIQNNHLSYVDIAIFPFIRQFYFVNPLWFESTPYPHLNTWLQTHLNSKLFLNIMRKYPTWQAGDETTIFP
ncbi:MAG: glutathione S-transferase [Proteobacteria bacterium]|nr:MAG: glutathione S-transferase [Pseudomonadota bacterium]